MRQQTAVEISGGTGLPFAGTSLGKGQPANVKECRWDFLGKRAEFKIIFCPFLSGKKDLSCMPFFNF